MIGIHVVVQYIDSATKGDLSVNHTQFAVHTPPAARHQPTNPQQGRKYLPLHAGSGKGSFKGLRQNRGSGAIDYQKHVYTPSRSARQRSRDPLATDIVVKNIGLHPHFDTAGIDDLNQACKKSFSPLQQLQMVTALQLGHGELCGWPPVQAAVNANSAINGK